MIFVIKEVVVCWNKQSKGETILAGFGFTAFVVFISFVCFIVVGGFVSLFLPKQEVVVNEYPVYSISENSFTLGRSNDLGYSEYYYQIGSGSEKLIESKSSENLTIKTSDTPKMTVTKVRFTDIWGDWVSSCWGYSNNYTLSIPQNTVIQ